MLMAKRKSVCESARIKNPSVATRSNPKNERSKIQTPAPASTLVFKATRFSGSKPIANRGQVSKSYCINSRERMHPAFQPELSCFQTDTLHWLDRNAGGRPSECVARTHTPAQSGRHGLTVLPVVLEADKRHAWGMNNPLISLSVQLATTVEQTARSIVAVHARPRFDSSGVYWSPGVVVTADHTIRRDEDLRVTAPGGSSLPAELAGRDPGTDLAVLRVPGLDLPAPPRAVKTALRPGEVALAVGRSEDGAIAAFGVVSSLSGPSQTWRGGRLDQVVRLDLSLHPGAEGGAVVDGAGNVVGIGTSALSRFAVFAVPVETIDRVAAKLLEHGRMPRAYLGVGLQPVAIPEHLKSKLNLPARVGLILVSVDPDAAAGRAGLLIGDILVELGGRAIERPENLQEALDADSIGKSVPARIVRGGEVKTVEITPGEKPRRS